MSQKTLIPDKIFEASEALIHRRPVVVRRQVKWGECDPAQVVYTPRFSEYVVSAAGFFFDEVLGKSFSENRNDRSNGYPLRALSFEFEKSLAAHEFFDMRVELVTIRRHTFELAITGLKLNGEVAFHCKFVPICIAADERCAVPLTPSTRAALQRYAAECAIL